MSRSQVEGGRRANAGPTDPGLVIETERQRLEDAFWEIYNKNVIDRKVLCDHIYGILLALMQNPVLMESLGDRFSIDQEGRVRFTINLSPNKPDPTLALSPVETNVEFEKNLQLQTNPENLKRQEQQLTTEQHLYDLAVQQILPIIRAFPNGTRVKTSFLRTFNNLYTDLQNSQEELQKLRENQGQVVKKVKAKKIGDWLLKQIEQGNST